MSTAKNSSHSPLLEALLKAYLEKSTVDKLLSSPESFLDSSNPCSFFYLTQNQLQKEEGERFFSSNEIKAILRAQESLRQEFWPKLELFKESGDHCIEWSTLCAVVTPDQHFMEIASMAIANDFLKEFTSIEPKKEETAVLLLRCCSRIGYCINHNFPSHSFNFAQLFLPLMLRSANLADCGDTLKDGTNGVVFWFFSSLRNLSAYSPVKQDFATAEVVECAVRLSTKLTRDASRARFWQALNNVAGEQDNAEILGDPALISALVELLKIPQIKLTEEEVAQQVSSSKKGRSEYCAFVTACCHFISNCTERQPGSFSKKKKVDFDKIRVRFQTPDVYSSLSSVAHSDDDDLMHVIYFAQSVHRGLFDA